MIRFVASDLDGTLLQNGAQQLPKEIYPMIRRLKELGILFAAASGRQYANMKLLFAPVLSDMAFICENGAMAVQDDRILYQDAFDHGLVQEIVKAVYEKEGAEFSCSTKDFYYVRPKSQGYIDLMTKTVKTNCRFIRDFSEIKEPCIKLAVYEEKGMSEESIRSWREKFSDRCTVVTSGFAWLDFIPFGTNKAKGIRKFQEILGIRPEECLVFGDEYNDIEMLKSVPYSFAMTHAKEGVRQAANYQTDRVEPVLEKLIAAKGDISRILDGKEKRCIQKNA